MTHLVSAGARGILAVAALAALGLGCVVEAGAPPEPTVQGTAKTSSAVVDLGAKTDLTSSDKSAPTVKDGLVLHPSLAANTDDEGPRPHPWTPPPGNAGDGINSGAGDDEGPRPHPWTPPPDNTNVGGTGDGSGTTTKPGK